MKKKHVIFVVFLLLIFCITYLIRYIYISDTRALDGDLERTRTIIQQSYTLYGRNRDKLPIDEYRNNFTFNSALLGGYSDNHFYKPYLPKYKSDLLLDINLLIANMSVQTKSYKHIELMYEYLMRISDEWNRTVDNRYEITKEKYTAIHSIILEYEKKKNELTE